jgi:hypothetical protein
MTETLIRPYPKIGEIFELSMPSPPLGLEMVRDVGIEDWERWRYASAEVTEPQVGLFKLIQVGACWSFAEVQNRMHSRGVIIPAGQWCPAFGAAFAHCGERRMAGIAAYSFWSAWNGMYYFPCIGRGGVPIFCWRGCEYRPYVFGREWDWLVQVVEVD